MKSYPYEVKIKRADGTEEKALVTGRMDWVVEYGAKDGRLLARILPNGRITHGLLGDDETIVEDEQNANVDTKTA